MTSVKNIFLEVNDRRSRLWHKVSMENVPFLTHFLFGLGLSGVSYILTHVMIKRVRIIDDPNARSSHSIPTPRSGGIAILCTFFMGLAALKFLGGASALDQDFFWVFVGASLLIAFVSIVDDLAGLGFRAKLATQLVSALVVMAFGVVIDSLGGVELGVWGYPLT